MTDISDQQLSAVPLEANHADAEITTIHIPLLCCCATSFYSICFSIIKYCGYWNSQTLDRITDHANKFYKENSMAITIHWLSTISQGHFKDMMQILILPLIWRNEEYLLYISWISNYCFSCIFQHNKMKTKAKSVKYYIIGFSPNGTLDIFEKVNDFLTQS